MDSDPDRKNESHVGESMQKHIAELDSIELRRERGVAPE